MTPDEEGSLRKSAQRMISRAAGAGMADAGRLMYMSPREIEWEFAALAARRQHAAEQADLQAWLAGRYVMAAVHAPRRYPVRPDGVAHRPREMNQEDMKKVFMAMAERKENNGGG